MEAGMAGAGAVAESYTLIGRQREMGRDRRDWPGVGSPLTYFLQQGNPS